MALCLAPAAQAATVSRTPAVARMPDGSAVDAVELANSHGLRARILTIGATLQSMIVPDRNGQPADVLLGFGDPADYVHHAEFFGATVGRFANRIGGGRFALDGREYHLPLNDGANSLHGGGPTGFDRQAWRIVGLKSDGRGARVTLAYTSPDGEAGYPGRLDATVTYTLGEDDALSVSMDATTTKPTVVNMTNHAYWNLAGEGRPGGAMNERLMIAATRYTPSDAHRLPTGERRAVAGTPFDFRTAHPIADGLRDGRDPQIRMAGGYDQNFALDKGETAEPGLAARLEDPASGRVMELLTTEPGLQLYSANGFGAKYAGKNGHLYRQGDGVALEPQKFPDAPNHPDFVSARVDPGRPYHHLLVFRFSTLPRSDPQ